MGTKQLNLALILAFATLTACGKAGGSSSVTSSASQGVSSIAGYGYTCTFTQVDEVTVSQDPTQNFSATNSLYTESVESNTCAGVSNGLVSSESVPTVTRSGSVITLADSSSSDTVTFSGNQATIPQSDLVACSSGVQSTGTLSGVELDPIGGTIRIYINWNLVINGCSSVATPSGQSAPTAVVIDPSPLPFPSASPSPSPSSCPALTNDTTSPDLIALQAGACNSVSLNQTQGAFSAFGQYTSGGSVEVNYLEPSGNQFNQFQITFSFPSGTLPAPGLYSGNININTSQSFSSFYGDISPGNFEVTDIQYDTNGVLVSVAINVMGAISGTVRYNQPQSVPAVYTPVADTSSLNQLSMQSGPGDYIGQGKNWNYIASDGTFQLVNFGSEVVVVFNSKTPGISWVLNFAVPSPNLLGVGTYVTTSAPMVAGAFGASTPSLSVFGDGDGCDSEVGQFQVLKATYDSNGNITTFEATFSQNCDWSAVPLQGVIRVGTLP